MSTIREHVSYTTHCHGCHHEYGEFESRSEAQEFIEEFPLCSNCDGMDNR